jgi:hypothetical protein
MITYGTECWPFTRKDRNILQIFEIKILRKIGGPVKGKWYVEIMA